MATWWGFFRKAESRRNALSKTSNPDYKKSSTRKTRSRSSLCTLTNCGEAFIATRVAKRFLNYQTQFVDLFRYTSANPSRIPNQCLQSDKPFKNWEHPQWTTTLAISFRPPPHLLLAASEPSFDPRSLTQCNKKRQAVSSLPER